MMHDEKFKEIKKKERKSRNKREKTSVEELFNQTSRLTVQIDAKLQEIEHWREFASKASAVYSAVGKGGGKPGKNKSKVEDCVCKIADIEESLRNDMDELIGLKEKLMRIIDKIDVPEYKSLLINRYVCGKTWEQVAESMGYSYVHIVNRLHPRALEKINGIDGTGADD